MVYFAIFFVRCIFFFRLFGLVRRQKQAVHGRADIPRFKVSTFTHTPKNRIHDFICAHEKRTTGRVCGVGRCQRRQRGGMSHLSPISLRSFLVSRRGRAQNDTRFWPPYIRMHTANVLVENGDAFVHHAFMSRDVDHPWWYSIKVERARSGVWKRSLPTVAGALERTQLRKCIQLHHICIHNEPG